MHGNLVVLLGCVYLDGMKWDLYSYVGWLEINVYTLFLPSSLNCLEINEWRNENYKHFSPINPNKYEFDSILSSFHSVQVDTTLEYYVSWFLGCSTDGMYIYNYFLLAICNSLHCSFVIQINICCCLYGLSIHLQCIFYLQRRF